MKPEKILQLVLAILAGEALGFLIHLIASLKH